ncbi:MAG: hypothetical protein VYE40_13295 [Myxococcota bacterium]|nr:hypothetical protein [Myxococcota bacterium]
MHSGTLEDVDPADVLLPVLYGVGYGFTGAILISLSEFFDLGIGLMVVGVLLVLVSLVTGIASGVREKGFKGVFSGILSGLGRALLLGFFALMVMGCLEEFYFLAIWIMPSLLLILSIAGGMSWEKHEGFKEGNGRLIWAGIAVLVYLMVRVMVASFWVILMGAVDPVEIITMISQRLFVPSMHTVAFTAIELGVLVGLVYSNLLDSIGQPADA